jgi:rubrerythrin
MDIEEIKAHYRSGAMSHSEAVRALKESCTPGKQGVCYFCWHSFPERYLFNGQEDGWLCPFCVISREVNRLYLAG